MVTDDIFEACHGHVDSREVDKDRSSLVAVTPGKVLRHHHHDPVRLIMHIENLAVIVGEITMLYGLRDEGPQQESLVGGLVVKDYAQSPDSLFLPYEENAAQKLLRKREVMSTSAGPVKSSTYSSISDTWSAFER